MEVIRENDFGFFLLTRWKWKVFFRRQIEQFP